MLLECAFDRADDAHKPLPALRADFDTPVLHVHGTVQPVSTRGSYRKLLYKTPEYLPFLRALTATSRFLFFGYSLSDAYFNELRSEVFAMLASGALSKESPRLGYHLQFWPGGAAETPEALRVDMDFRGTHEGLLTLPTGPRTAFATPQILLRELVRRASPQAHFARSFFGRRILAFELPHACAAERDASFEETALALHALAFAVPGLDGEPPQAELRRVAQLRFRRARDDFDALCAALHVLEPDTFLPPLSRPPQSLQLPGGGEVRISFDTQCFCDAACSESWDVLLVHSRAEDAEGPAGALARARKETMDCGRESAPALAFGNAIDGRLRARFRARGFVDCVDSGESIVSALHSLLSECQYSPPIK
jgi:hypothetical protein